MSLSSPFIRRPVATSLLTVGLALAGAIAYTQLPGGSAAAGGISHHQRVGGSAGRESGDDGVHRGHPARAPVRPHRRHHGDDVEQQSGQHQYRAAVRSESRYRRRRARRAGRHQRRARTVAGQPAEQPALPQDQSRRRAHHDHRRHLRSLRGRPDVRCGGLHPGAEAVAGGGHRPGVRRRRRAARGARRIQSPRAEFVRHRSLGRADRARQRPTRTGPRELSATGKTSGRSTRPTSCTRPTSTAAWSSRIAMAPPCGWATSPM